MTGVPAPEGAESITDREALGQMVRQVWVACALELPDPKPSNIAPWEEISEWDREVDRRIGEAVAAHAATVVSLEMCRVFGREIGAVQVERDEALAKLAELAEMCAGDRQVMAIIGTEGEADRG